MSDRLSELRRQRVLLEQHLAWLDREMAAEGQPAPASPPSPAPAAPPPSPQAVLSVSGAAPVAGPATEQAFDEYRVAPDTLRNDVRKGCLLYLALAFILLIGGVAILWLALRR